MDGKENSAEHNISESVVACVKKQTRKKIVDPYSKRLLNVGIKVFIL